MPRVLSYQRGSIVIVALMEIARSEDLTSRAQIRLRRLAKAYCAAHRHPACHGTSAPSYENGSSTFGIKPHSASTPRSLDGLAIPWHHRSSPPTVGIRGSALGAAQAPTLPPWSESLRSHSSCKYPFPIRPCPNRATRRAAFFLAKTYPATKTRPPLPMTTTPLERCDVGVRHAGPQRALPLDSRHARFRTKYRCIARWKR